MLIYEKSLKAQLRRRLDYSGKVEALQYQLDGTVAIELRAQNSVESHYIQLVSARSVFQKFRQRLPEWTESLTADDPDDFSDCLYDLLKAA